eukprot:TRINITY_DN286_c2_g5_i1.p1 TRINITY_DN286_c2_g5~~TRINITY_DN286_c2_g5_i1.p1  ORF type:complete len:1249 (+),score=229.31 TRINITY_DN286_c2_g5_i1:197-3943(+)
MGAGASQGGQPSPVQGANWQPPHRDSPQRELPGPFQTHIHTRAQDDSPSFAPRASCTALVSTARQDLPLPSYSSNMAPPWTRQPSVPVHPRSGSRADNCKGPNETQGLTGMYPPQGTMSSSEHLQSTAGSSVNGNMRSPRPPVTSGSDLHRRQSERQWSVGPTVPGSPSQGLPSPTGVHGVPVSGNTPQHLSPVLPSYMHQMLGATPQQYPAEPQQGRMYEASTAAHWQQSPPPVTVPAEPLQINLNNVQDSVPQLPLTAPFTPGKEDGGGARQGSGQVTPTTPKSEVGAGSRGQLRSASPSHPHQRSATSTSGKREVPHAKPPSSAQIAADKGKGKDKRDATDQQALVTLASPNTEGITLPPNSPGERDIEQELSPRGATANVNLSDLVYHPQGKDGDYTAMSDGVDEAASQGTAPAKEDAQTAKGSSGGGVQTAAKMDIIPDVYGESNFEALVMQRVKEQFGDKALKWTKGSLIGSGTFGKVFRALEHRTGRQLAIKEIPLTKNEVLRELKKEIDVLKLAKHPNVVSYIGLDRVKSTAYILMEFVPGGSIAHALKMFGPFPEQVAAQYTRQISVGVAYLHYCKIVHRDLKGANILLTASGRVKLADFGSAKSVLDATGVNTSVSMSVGAAFKTVRGTPYWMAPEVITEEGHGPPADVWSVGCTVIEMLTGRPPYSGMNQMSAMHQIAQGVRPNTGDAIGESAQKLINACLIREKAARPKAREILQFEWIKEQTDWMPRDPSEDFAKKRPHALPDAARPAGGSLDGPKDNAKDQDRSGTPSPRDELPLSETPMHRRQSSPQAAAGQQVRPPVHPAPPKSTPTGNPRETPGQVRDTPLTRDRGLGDGSGTSSAAAVSPSEALSDDADLPPSRHRMSRRKPSEKETAMAVSPRPRHNSRQSSGEPARSPQLQQEEDMGSGTSASASRSSQGPVSTKPEAQREERERDKGGDRERGRGRAREDDPKAERERERKERDRDGDRSREFPRAASDGHGQDRPRSAHKQQRDGDGRPRERPTPHPPAKEPPSDGRMSRRVSLPEADHLAHNRTQRAGPAVPEKRPASAPSDCATTPEKEEEASAVVLPSRGSAGPQRHQRERGTTSPSASTPLGINTQGIAAATSSGGETPSGAESKMQLAAPATSTKETSDCSAGQGWDSDEGLPTGRDEDDESVAASFSQPSRPERHGEGRQAVHAKERRRRGQRSQHPESRTFKFRLRDKPKAEKKDRTAENDADMEAGPQTSSEIVEEEK